MLTSWRAHSYRGALVTSHISPGARVPCQPRCSGDVENLQEILGRRSSSLFFQCGGLTTVRNASSAQWGPSVSRCPLTASHTFKMRCLCRLLTSRKTAAAVAPTPACQLAKVNPCNQKWLRGNRRQLSTTSCNCVGEGRQGKCAERLRTAI